MTHRLPIHDFTCIYRYLIVFIGEKKMKLSKQKATICQWWNSVT